MKKTLYYIFIFFLLFNFSAFSQSEDKNCLCSIIKNTEENDSKVFELGQYIETDFHNYEAGRFVEKFNTKAFTNIILNDFDDIKNKTTYNENFIKGFKKGVLVSDQEMAKKILQQINDGALYNFISYEYNIQESAYYITFRIYSEEIGINYHDYKVCSDGTDFMFNDIYVYLTGEHLSETMRRLFLIAQPKQSKSKLKSLFGIKETQPISIFLEAKKLYENGNAKAAFDKISTLEGSFAKEKFILIYKSEIASLLSDDIYKKQIEEFSKLYPNDPTLYLKQIDYYLIKENYRKAIELIDKLQFETEDDFLNLLKGNTSLMAENYKAAEEHYFYMINNYPNLLEGYVGYICSLTYQSRFQEAIDTTEILIEQGYEKKVLTDFFEEKEADGSNALQMLCKCL